MLSKTSFSVYIHIPFCVQKCAYCDFASCVATQEQIEAYIEALISEMKLQMIERNPMILFGHTAPKTIFIGGGTPSILSVQQFERIVDALKNHFDLTNVLEFTVEANPGTLHEALVACYKRNGVNRISMGVQSFQDEQLIQLGRIHRADDVRKGIALLRRYQMPRISIDLMIGLPDQTMEALKSDLDEAIALDVDHISVYSLIIEPGTRLNDLYEAGRLELPSETLERQMYWYAVQRLKDAGYFQYEISNFSKPNEESQHNLVYWHCEYYYGFGVAAHGRLPNERSGNEENIETYLVQVNRGLLPINEKVEVGHHEWLEEWIMLGLRLNAGICPEHLEETRKQIFDERYKNRFENAIKEGYLLYRNHCYVPTEKGINLNNQMLMSLLFD